MHNYHVKFGMKINSPLRQKNKPCNFFFFCSAKNVTTQDLQKYAHLPCRSQKSLQRKYGFMVLTEKALRSRLRNQSPFQIITLLAWEITEKNSEIWQILWKAYKMMHFPWFLKLSLWHFETPQDLFWKHHEFYNFF